jgi:hypothetical protein
MVGALLLSTSAFGAGAGYTPGPPTGPTPPGGQANPPGFTTIVTSQTVPPSGGTVTGSSGGTTVTVIVPPGAFASPIQIIITVANLSELGGIPSGTHPVLGVGIAFEQNGAKYTGTFAAPVSVTITNSEITTADQVVVWDPATGTYVPITEAPNVTNVVVSAGKITFQVLSDPYLVLDAPNASTVATVIPNATSAITGVPVFSEGIVGGLLVLGGLWLAVRLRRKRSAAGAETT